MAIAKRLQRDGLDRPMVKKVRRELRKMRAQGILEGLVAGLRPGDFCVDCGANVGEVTGVLAKTGATVHAFEPDPKTFAALEKSCGALENVTLEAAAVGTEAGQATLYRSGISDAEVGATGASIIADNAFANPNDTVDVPVIDLIAFLEKAIADHGHVAFLKMDIEGAELDILERLLQTDILRHVRFTAVETHRWLLPGSAERFDKLHETSEANPDLNLFLGWI